MYYFGSHAPRLATAPVNWNNDDVPDYRTHTAFEPMLAQMREAGFHATEWGSIFPESTPRVAAALRAEGLQLAGAFVGVRFMDDAAVDAALPHVARVAERLQVLGAHDILLSDQVCPERSAVAGRAGEPDAPRLNGGSAQRFLANLERTVDLVRRIGLKPSFHHHVGTYIESLDEIGWLLYHTDPTRLGLCLDTGHLVYGGADPRELLRRHGERVTYVHLKDVDPTVLAQARKEHWSFQQALRNIIFPHLGEGLVDIRQVLVDLNAYGYEGWLVVEQDTCREAPLEAARFNRQYLSDNFGL